MVRAIVEMHTMTFTAIAIHMNGFIANVVLNDLHLNFQLTKLNSNISKMVNANAKMYNVFYRFW